MPNREAFKLATATAAIVNAALERRPAHLPAIDIDEMLSLPERTAKQWRKLATSSPAWPHIMRQTGINSGTLSKTDAAAICVILGIEDDADLADAPETEADPAPASGDATDEADTFARDTLREIFGALGQGDNDRPRQTLADLHRRWRDEQIRAEQEAARADRAQREASAAPAHEPRAGDPNRTGSATLREIAPQAVAKALPGQTGAINLPAYDAPDAAPDGGYTPDPEALAALATADSTQGNLWLYGPAGTGKSSLPEWYAATLGRPFYRVAFDRSTEPEDLIGGMEPDGAGGFAWRDGVLAQAIRTPGAVVLLDEPTLARPTALAMLQTLLDGGRMLLARATGERIRCAPDVLFVAADNTSGTGDESGQYVGTAAMNRAFLDRMSQRVEIGYMPKRAETAALHRRTGLAKDACAMLVDFAQHTRSAWEAGDMASPLGFRRLMAWARAIRAGWPSERAFVTTCRAGETPDDREAVSQLAVAYLDHAAIDRAAS